MKRAFVGAMALLASAAVSAGVMDPGWSCHMYGKVYQMTREDVMELMHRAPFYTMNMGPGWFNAVVFPVGVANDFHHQYYDSALPARMRDLSNVVACGRKYQCEWASPKSVAADMKGATVPEGTCPH